METKGFYGLQDPKNRADNRMLTYADIEKANKMIQMGYKKKIVAEHLGITYHTLWAYLSGKITPKDS